MNLYGEVVKRVKDSGRCFFKRLVDGSHVLVTPTEKKNTAKRRFQ